MIWVSRCKCDDCGSVPCDENYESGDDFAPCDENYESDGDSDKESFEGAV